MKNFCINNLLLSISLFWGIYSTHAQTPQAFNYQAMALDKSNRPYNNQTIHIQISLLEGGANGTAVYVERHKEITSSNGIFSLQIGKGTIQSGHFSDADWSAHPYWIKVEADFSGGDNFILLSNQKMLSVPYALHAKTAEDVDDADADATNEIQTLSLAGNKISLSKGGGSINLPPPTMNTDDQTLQLNGTQLSIEDGNTVNLSSFKSPWKKDPQTGNIEYRAATAIAQIVDSAGALNLTTSEIRFKDSSQTKTYFRNGELLYNREVTISPDLVLINPISGIGTDSLYFEDFTQDPMDINRSMMSKKQSYFYNKTANNVFESYMDPVQMEMRINDSEAKANYDAYGLYSTTYDSTGVFNDSELDAKAGIGLFVAEDDGFGGRNASLTNQFGIQIGQGFTYGIMDYAVASLTRDTLKFDYYPNQGMASGYAHYGRDEALLKIDIGGFSHSSILSPYGLSMNTGNGTDSIRLNLNSQHLEFENPFGGNSFASFGYDSIFMSKYIGLLFPDKMTLKPNKLLFASQFMQTYMDNHSFGINSISSSSDVFQRIGIDPNGMMVHNENQWKTAYLGTGNGGTAGQLDIWNGVSPFKLVQLGGDNLDPNAGSLQLFFNDPGSNPKVNLRIRNQTGELYLQGKDNLNVFIGAHAPNRGLVGVYDLNGDFSAGMFVDSSNRGHIESEVIIAGGLKGAFNGTSSPYPLTTIQTPLYGMNLETSKDNWEFFIQESGDMGLYANNALVGRFDVSTGVYSSLSDKRYKTNFRPMASLLPQIMKMNPLTYEYKTNNPHHKSSMGFIAQDIRSIFPELVKTAKNKYGDEILTLDYSGLGVVAIKAIQEQQEIIQQQGKQLESMQKKLDELNVIVQKLVEKQ